MRSGREWWWIVVLDLHNVKERERERDGGEVSEKERNREDRQTHIYGEEVGVVVVHKIWKRCE